QPSYLFNADGSLATRPSITSVPRQPSYLFNADGSLATRPSITSVPSSISYGNSFSIVTPDAANIASVVLVRNGTVTHAFGMDQREVGLSFTAGSGALTATAPPNGNIAPPGYYMLFILNNSGVPSVGALVQVTATPDFTLSATPSSRTVPPGTAASYNVSVAPTNGFTGNVTFTVSGLPSGATFSFNPGSVTGSGSTVLAVNTSSSTPTGTYPVTINASSGTLTHSTQVTLVVADFSVSVSPNSDTVKRGSQTSYTVTVSALGPFSATINLSVTGLPSRTSFSFSPTAIVGSGSSKFTVSVKKPATTGTYPLAISATGGGMSHSVKVSLVIN
ncbi:MAG TPA: galactose oxidase-like domain-containing protein, partial [Terriglobales bacterium]|nr:galactose oxidase-like domain-containing protein [Terriglobales bacterium]